jgi:hypothetical protein
VKYCNQLNLEYNFKKLMEFKEGKKLGPVEC